ncbi:conserved hypothetical protein [Frankia canadensis]|uniref:Uncharacterized protein n=1 Tax=Frankia canadensis TaxID=1836972 RepID=A0A2I2KP06_9ACTN|nr:hypothetical protein [Frankia canadensis]SNQ47407.1 conserved hypothetical protein [Frankia canadensis]SOU54697.1 conserved hypothetical protein [Frankia canadensis]
MYAWIYRHLPGPRRLRPGLAAVLLLAIVALLMFVIFPAVEGVLPISQVTLGD